MIPVHEIRHTLHGEGNRAGERCALVRLHGCNLSCRWCDTPQGGVTPALLSVEEIVARAAALDPPSVLVTGGEPLAHAGTPALCAALLGAGLPVVVETNGSLDVSVLPRGAARVVDLKAPSSGCADRNRLANVHHLTAADEVKIVVADRADYEWAARTIARHLAGFPGTVRLSPAAGLLPAEELARWMIEDRARARLGLQLHKVVFPGGEP